MARDPLARDSVRRVQAALTAGGSPAVVRALADTARSAADAAQALDCPVGAIVKSLVFVIDPAPTPSRAPADPAGPHTPRVVLALIAGDREAVVAALPQALGIAGSCRRADAATVREATGFAIGGVAPLGHSRPLPVVLDAALGRFPTVHAAAGHPHCVFATSLTELARLTGGVVSAAISAPLPAASDT